MSDKVKDEDTIEQLKQDIVEQTSWLNEQRDKIATSLINSISTAMTDEEFDPNYFKRAEAEIDKRIANGTLNPKAAKEIPEQKNVILPVEPKKTKWQLFKYNLKKIIF